MDNASEIETADTAPLETVPRPSPASRLPTLQRNALRKLFDRVEFTPEEVAALGYRKLKLADGIGEKGMKTIVAWLAEYGQTLAPAPARPRRIARRNGGGWTLQSALRLLRVHGYEIQAPERPPRQGRKASPSKFSDDS